MCLCKPKLTAKPASCSSHIDGNPFVGLPNSHLTTTETFCLKCTGVVITLSYQSDVHPKPCSTGLTWHGAGRSANLPCHALLQNTVLQKKQKLHLPMTPVQVATGLRHTENKKYSAAKTRAGLVTLAKQTWLCLARHTDYMGKSAVFFS